MGRSCTGYRRCGFWARDAALEAVLALLVLELEALAREDRGLEAILGMWTARSVAGFGGCAPAGLDEHLARQPGLDEVVAAALRRIRERLPRDGSTEVLSPDLARGAGRACEGNGRAAPGALARGAGNVADALGDLVAGRLPGPPGAPGSPAGTGGAPSGCTARDGRRHVGVRADRGRVRRRPQRRL